MPETQGVKRIFSVLVATSFAASVLAQEQAKRLPNNNQIQVTTREVIVPITVIDRSGEFVIDLAQKDFTIYEDAIRQKIDSWELGGEPLDVVLLIETSSRVSPMQTAIHRSASIFTSTVMTLSGEAAVMTYDSVVEVAEPFTDSQERVEKAIAETRFNGGDAYLYDAMATAVEFLKTRPPARHRVLLIMGESQDNSSKAKLAQVLRDAANANIRIYAVGLSTAAGDLRSNKHGVTPLKVPGLPPLGTGPCVDVQGRQCFDLAAPAIWLLERGTSEIKHHQLELATGATGGIDYRTFHDSEIQQALDRIGAELHAQYVVSYSPSSKWAPGFHKITVAIDRAEVSLRARPGYYVQAGESSRPPQ
jgi:VWFA-related protein